jgi:putative ABC transport system permease protein
MWSHARRSRCRVRSRAQPRRTNRVGNVLGPGYFQTIGTPLLAGRDFDDRDTATSVKVAIVNPAFARQILKSADPLGKRFRIHESPGKPRPLYEAVGVTADNNFQDMHEEFLPFMYFPSTQEEKPSPDDHILICSSLPLTSLIASIKETIANANPGIDFEFLVFKTRIQDSLLQDELMATLSGFFGFLAALLAAIGLYGVMSYMVIQRTKEIGIRIRPAHSRNCGRSPLRRRCARQFLAGLSRLQTRSPDRLAL